MCKKVDFVCFVCLVAVILVQTRAQPIKWNKLYGITDKYFQKKDKLLDKVFNKEFHIHVHDHHLHHDYVQINGDQQNVDHYQDHRYDNKPHEHHDQHDQHDQYDQHHQHQQQPHQDEHQHLEQIQNQHIKQQHQSNEPEYVVSGQHNNANTENSNQPINTQDVTTKEPEFVLNVQPSVENSNNHVQPTSNYGYQLLHNNNVAPNNNHIVTNQPLTLQQHQALAGNPVVFQQQVPPIINHPVFLLPPEYSLHYDYSNNNNNNNYGT